MAVNRDYRRMIETTLDQYGVGYTIKHGRHTNAEFVGRDGRRYVTTLVVTNSANSCSAANARAALRRQLTAAGYIDVQKPKAAEPVELEQEQEPLRFRDMKRRRRDDRRRHALTRQLESA